MNSVKKPDKKVLKRFDYLFKMVKENMGFLPNSMEVMARIPALLASFTNLSGILIGDPKKVKPFKAFRLNVQNMIWSLQFLNRKDRVPMYLRNLVAHVSSNASGCRYCQAHTISEASHNGAKEKQLEEIWNFETSDAFDDAEKAALRFGYAAGCVPNQVEQAHFTELKKYYNDEQILELGAIVSLFGFLNRWNDTFGTQLEDQPMKAAEKYLKQQGWEIGKHS